METRRASRRVAPKGCRLDEQSIFDKHSIEIQRLSRVYRTRHIVDSTVDPPVSETTKDTREPASASQPASRITLPPRQKARACKVTLPARRGAARRSWFREHVYASNTMRRIKQRRREMRRGGEKRERGRNTGIMTERRVRGGEERSERAKDEERKRKRDAKMRAGNYVVFYG